MKVDIIDHNVNLTMNIFLIIANIINVIQNVPQIYKTYKTKSTRDFSGWFLLLRVMGNSIWLGYAVEIDSMLMLINSGVTIIATSFIGKYKISEIISDWKKKKPIYKQLNNRIEYIDNPPPDELMEELV
jgi:MtN3 and saliva related transmembrane protein